MLKTRTCLTSELRPGDVVLCHGGMFRLLDNRRERKEPGDRLPVYWFCPTVFLGDIPGSVCQIPEHWRFNWNVQGNDLAYWEVLLTVEEIEAEERLYQELVVEENRRSDFRLDR